MIALVMSAVIGVAMPVGDVAAATTVPVAPIDTVDESTDEAADETADEASEQIAPAPAAAAPRALAADIAPLAAGDPVSCSYGNTGTGQYKDTICWFDFSYIEGAAKKAISTEWVETSLTHGSCSYTTTLFGYVYTCSATTTFRSILGEAYGVQTATASGSGSASWNRTTAESNGRTAATNAARNALGLHYAGGKYYGDITGYPFVVQLPNSTYRFEALLDITAPAGVPAKAIVAASYPTWTGAFLGNNGFYTGVTGYPALYQAVDAGGTGVSAANRTTTIRLREIKMFSGSSPVSGYSVVMADAESTDGNEQIRFSHSGGSGMQWLPNNPVAFTSAGTDTQRRNAAVGSQVCLGTSVTAWSSITIAGNSVTCIGTSTTKNGTAMVNVLPPASPSASWSVTQELQGGGRQGVAFGVLMARANLTVNVADRVIDSTGNPTTAEFQASVSAAGSVPSVATTGPTALTGEVTPSFPLPATGTQLNFAGVPNAYDSSYTQSWQCTKTGDDTPAYWPATGQTSSTPPPTDDAWFVLKPGYYIGCTVTYTPPYVTLLKSVNQNGTAAANTAAHWDLTLAGSGAFAATTSNSTRAGAATATAALKRPIAVNSADPADVYTLGETGPTSSPWMYGYDWTNITCSANSGSTAFPSSAFTKTTNSEGQVTSATLKVAKGNNITCTYTNTANKPHLIVKKDAFAAPGTFASSLLNWGTAVPAQSTVYYRVTFDNTGGTAAMSVAYTDHLGDVLDDATFNAGSLRYGTGSETGYATASTTANGVIVTDNHSATDPTLVFTGSVPARQSRTVWFSVTTLANDTDALTRADGFSRGSGVTNVLNRVGFALNNYVLETGKPIPATCADPSTVTPSTESSCTSHPLAAWSVAKQSQPEDGAMIHAGGNIYYRVKVTNYSGATMTGVQITDDMTQTLAATLWDPTAPAAVTVPYGISFYTASGAHIPGADIVWDAATGPKPVFGLKPGATGDPAEFDSDVPGGLPFPNGRWTFTTPAFDIPATINGQKVAYAIVGYAVRGGQVASPSDPAQQYQANGTMPVRAASGATWINTAAAGAATINGQPAQPSTCSADSPAGSLDDECRTFHALGDSYFHIWKKSANEGVNGSGQNLTGSVFVLADTEADALAGIASRWLCRVGYAVPDPADPMSEPAYAVGSLTGTGSGANALDIGKDSATYQSIQDANQVRLAYNIANGLNEGAPGYRPQLDQCGLFFELQGPGLDDGQAPGSWRAMDVRGGDMTADGSAPLPKWRTQSALNDPADPSQGRHGTYWVAEMKSPENHQLLAAPFKLWVAPNAPTPGGLYPGHPKWYDYQGKLSLPYVGEGEPEPAVPPGAPQLGGIGTTTDDGLKLRQMCVDAWQLPVNNQPSCVMPTGWTMPVFDVKMPALPFTGGTGPWGLVLTGGGVFAAALLGAWWWRRRSASTRAQR